MHGKGLFTFSVFLLLLPLLLLSLEFGLHRQASLSSLQTRLMAVEQTGFLRSETELNFDLSAKNALKLAFTADQTTDLLASIDPALKASEELTGNSAEQALLQAFVACRLYHFLWQTEEHYAAAGESLSLKFFLVTLDPYHYPSALEKLGRRSANPVALDEPGFLLELPQLFLVEKEEGKFIWTGGRKQNRTLLGLIQAPDLNQAFLLPVGYSVRVDSNASP